MSLLIPSRRGFLGGLTAAICAPAIVRASSLMPVRALPPELLKRSAPPPADVFLTTRCTVKSVEMSMSAHGVEATLTLVPSVTNDPPLFFVPAYKAVMKQTWPPRQSESNLSPQAQPEFGWTGELKVTDVDHAALDRLLQKQATPAFEAVFNCDPALAMLMEPGDNVDIQARIE